MDKIGLITFHRVYNYGAVIQAYAMQQVLEKEGYDCTILDFSKRKQLDYTNIISIRNGLKRFLKSMMLLVVYSKRNARKQKFDIFINHKLRLTSKTFRTESSIEQIKNDYDFFCVGSDQVWNVKKESDTSSTYFLSFVNDKKRVSYASSVGTSNYNDLKRYKEELLKFDHISCREKGGASELTKLLEREVPVVLDPTLLATRYIYDDVSNIKYESNYILYYTLDGKDKCKNNMDILCELKTKFNLELKIIAPEWPFHNAYGEDIIDAGPEEFLSLIKNAALVCTTSFHGTALSLEFEKPFYVLESRNIKDERKRSILEQVGVTERIISSVEEIKSIESYKMNYETISKNIDKLREASRKYLMDALQR